MDHTVIFCHLPKASGTSLRAVIKRQYEASAILKLDGRDAEKSVREYKALPIEEKLKIDEIDGHYPVGLHRLVPKPCTYITLLRDPVDRVISYYYHVLRDPEHYVYRQGFTNRTSLLEFVRIGIARTEIWNGQTWFLSGGISMAEKPMEALSMAKKNLRELFAVAGLCERFDESVILMMRKLQWKKIPVYYRRHVALSRPTLKDISPETLQAIREVNQLDIELYGYVADRLNKQIRAEGSSFAFELKLFKLTNSLYQKLIQIRFLAGEMKGSMLKS